MLSGVDVAALDLLNAKHVGLLSRVDRSDVIDGHDAQLVEPGDHLLTSDPQDMANCSAIEHTAWV